MADEKDKNDDDWGPTVPIDKARPESERIQEGDWREKRERDERDREERRRQNDDD